MSNLINIVIVVMFAGVCVACTPVPPPTSAPAPTSPESPTLGNASNGAQIFTQGVNQSPPCSSCHFVASSQTGFNLGPNLASIAERAANRVDGMNAEEYIHESIVDPRRYVVPGYRNLMYPDYAEHISEQDIQDLAAYLLTLEG
jgi:cytochrome c2